MSCAGKETRRFSSQHPKNSLLYQQEKWERKYPPKHYYVKASVVLCCPTKDFTVDRQRYNLQVKFPHPLQLHCNALGSTLRGCMCPPAFVLLHSCSLTEFLQQTIQHNHRREPAASLRLCPKQHVGIHTKPVNAWVLLSGGESPWTHHRRHFMVCRSSPLWHQCEW